MLRTATLLSVSTFASALAGRPSAQVQVHDHEWASFAPLPGALDVGEAISSGFHEVDFAVGDLDGDGDDDLVVVRKEPFTKPGPRTNMLLLSEDGVLRDRTALFATASDVLGDQGFLTPTTDRDVKLADLDGDGWLDVVTCTALMDGQPKALSHPRVYRNLAASGGAWLGLEHQEARIPQLVTFGAGLAVATHANEVLVGDVDADGAPDLYFVDHDSGFAGYSEPSSWDLDDRLLINDGLGYFTDETVLRMTSAMVTGGFGVGGLIGDFNLDGANDVLRGSTGNISDPVQEISLAYNAPSAVGTFNIYQEVYSLSPYAVASGDLNQDGRLDVVAGDDQSDRYLLNTGTDALGRVIWSPAKLFDFLNGGDDGFTGQVTIADLDHDGWNDVLIADEDIDIAQSTGENRRMHIYHNLGGEPGSEVVLREERESPGAGWIGVEGLHETQLRKTYDVALLDVDGDGWDDLVIGRNAGTVVWRNTTGDQVCQTDLGFAGPGPARLSMCGDALAPGQAADVVVRHAAPNSPGLIAFGVAQANLAYAGGTLVPIPMGVLAFTTDAAGKWVLPDVEAPSGPATLYLQAGVLDAAQPFGVAITNAIQAEFLP